MKYSFKKERILYILFFNFLFLHAQKVTIKNKTNEDINIENGIKYILIKSNEAKELSDILGVISLKIANNNRNINLFLDPNDKIILSVAKDNSIIYTGDKAPLHEYINQKLNVDSYGKMTAYRNAIEKKNLQELKNISEFLIVDIMKKAKLENLVTSDSDTESIKRLKKHIKYNWLYTIFSMLDLKNTDKNFQKEAMGYYYKKYIILDIAKYSCNGFFPYEVIKILSKNKALLQIEMPSYSIVEKTDDNLINQFLPVSCQKYYFLNKYYFLDHINSSEKEYYKKVLYEKFNN